MSIIVVPRCLLAVPMLAKLVTSDSTEAIDLSNATTIEIGTASFRAIRGYSDLIKIDRSRQRGRSLLAVPAQLILSDPGRALRMMWSYSGGRFGGRRL
jgi:hypothetical protein